MYRIRCDVFHRSAPAAAASAIITATALTASSTAAVVTATATATPAAAAGAAVTWALGFATIPSAAPIALVVLVLLPTLPISGLAALGAVVAAAPVLSGGRILPVVLRFLVSILLPLLLEVLDPLLRIVAVLFLLLFIPLVLERLQLVQLGTDLGVCVVDFELEVRRIARRALEASAAHLADLFGDDRLDQVLRLCLLHGLGLLHYLRRSREQRLLLLGLVVIHLLRHRQHRRAFAFDARDLVDDVHRQRGPAVPPIVSDPTLLGGDPRVALADRMLQALQALELIVPSQVLVVNMRLKLLPHDLRVDLITSREISFAAQHTCVQRANAH
mmetsp:Transcript_34495/g.91759  ORF Transcript_34495/g.91759 Transcript_34495/m.91759 type:complete len:330 (-) Transcript_34495:232-1221(-)